MDKKFTPKDFERMLQTELDNELDAKPTFSEEMASHIRRVYEQLEREREEWLKNHNSKQE